MYDLSLHILDLIENALRAGASTVGIEVALRGAPPELEIVIEDNGPGLDVPAQGAVDPFYTTKPGKRTGLGLSLFKAAAERAGGGLTLDTSPLGGLRVRARMLSGHIDLSPLGDLAATLASVALTHPDLDLRARLGSAGCIEDVRLGDTPGADLLERAERFAERVRIAAQPLCQPEPAAPPRRRAAGLARSGGKSASRPIDAQTERRYAGRHA